MVLPAYNESPTDEHLGFSIIVVDDGNSDRTRNVLEEYGREFPLTVHRHEQNQGLGATIRDGLRQAAAVGGSRVYGLGLGRRIISSVASLLMRVLFPTPGVSDYTCGYRAYRAGVLQQAYAQYGESMRLMKTSVNTLALLWRRRTGLGPS